ncbi:hypothetical protein GLYMA_07G239451v4 [Glycine max]|nr:hypothetical protein GLYMA_07G239451v4 [Glycine max]KAH1088344.1 hypothetical protein GYH30_019407 [Glycine max]
MQVFFHDLLILLLYSLQADRVNHIAGTYKL